MSRSSLNRTADVGPAGTSTPAWLSLLAVIGTALAFLLLAATPRTRRR